MLKQLAPQDAQFVYLQHGNALMHVMGVNIYDPTTAPGGKVRLKDLVHHVESRLDCSPVFRRRLMRLPYDLDHPYWVEDPFFDIEHHVFHGRLDRPGSWDQLCAELSRHFSRPMDMNRPLWDMFVLEGLNTLPGLPRGSFAIAYRIHHAACDGASIRQIFNMLSDSDVDGTPAVELTPSTEELGEAPSTFKVLNRALAANLRSPAGFARTMAHYTPSVLKTAGALLKHRSAPRAKVPQTRFNQGVSPHKLFDVAFMGLDDLKRVKQQVKGATLNDAILAVCGGALRRYLEHHDELPEEPLVALAPVSRKGGNGSSLGNDLTVMPVPLATDLEVGLDRLRAIRDTTVKTKEAKEGIGVRVFVDINEHVPALFQAPTAQILTRFQMIGKYCNLLVSNVPGPPEPLYMCGARMRHNFGMAPVVDGMGLFIAVGSYAGELSFTIVSNREIMPDIKFFRQCLLDSFADLLAET